MAHIDAKALRQHVLEASEHELESLLRAVEARLGRAAPDEKNASWPKARMPVTHGPYLSRDEMDAVQASMEAWAAQGGPAARGRSRHRLLVLFLLLRYGGLRLGEALAFDSLHDFDRTAGVIRIGGRHGREVQLPQETARQLAILLDSPMFYNLNGRVTDLDPGYVRRKLYECAHVCGMEKQRLNPRNLRISRGLELILGGVPQRAVAAFLGRGADVARDMLKLTDDAAQKIVRVFVETELRQSASPRNIFTGVITKTNVRGLLADVLLELPGGHIVHAVITDNSLARLALRPGALATASIKALWASVCLMRPVQDKHCENVMPGVITGLRVERDMAEILMKLDSGDQGCAVMPLEHLQSLTAEVGQRAYLLFSGVSVVITVE